MDYIYILERYDIDGYSLAGVYTTDILAIETAKELLRSNLDCIMNTGDEDIFADKEYVDGIMQFEGYQVFKIPLNQIYSKKECIFDTYEYYEEMRGNENI